MEIFSPFRIDEASAILGRKKILCGSGLLIGAIVGLYRRFLAGDRFGGGE